MKSTEFIKESLTEAADDSWVQAYKALEANGGEPTPENKTLFIKQLAILAKNNGIDQFGLVDLIKQYVPGPNSTLINLQSLVKPLLATAPTIEEIKQYSQQSQAQATQFQQSQEVSAAKHNATIQQIISQSQLDQADTQAVLAMDVEARRAILERKQDLELEAKERLHKLQMEIDARSERAEVRDHELKVAEAGYKHELAVIKLTAEGEYKKAKLEADYQIKIKELENIDNAGERQSKLDVINTNKAKELALIDAETQAKVTSLRAETEATQAESDIRVQEAFMMTFKPIWGSLIERASELGKTLGQSISAVTGALERLSKPVMPKAQKPDDVARLKQLAGR